MANPHQVQATQSVSLFLVPVPPPGDRSDMVSSKQTLLEAGGRDKWIEMQRVKGEQKRLERESLKEKDEGMGGF
jgi:hypothetical protein